MLLRRIPRDEVGYPAIVTMKPELPRELSFP